MPDRGQRQLDTATLPAIGNTEEWTCPGASWLQFTFEASREVVLEQLPGDVTRTVPCYARLFVADMPQSPAGPMRLAALLMGGRYQMQARNVVADAIVDGPVEACRDAFGAGFQPGNVELRRDGSHASASVAAEGGQLASVQLPALRALDPAMLRWDVWANVARDGSEGPQVVDCPLAPAIDHAFLTKGATLETPKDLPRAHLWRRARSLNTISACYAEGTLVFGRRQFHATVTMP